MTRRRRWTVDEQIIHHASGFQFRFTLGDDGAPVLDVVAPVQPGPRSCSLLFNGSEPLCLAWLTEPKPLTWVRAAKK